MEERERNEDESFLKTSSKAEIVVTWKDIWYQIVVCNLGYLFSVHAGINLAFSNLLLKEFDAEVTSWFASIVGLSTPIGSVIGGPIMDKIGRKKTNLAAAFPCLLSWGLLYLTANDDVLLLYFARFLAGISGGMMISNVVYVSEVSHKQYRSIFLSLLGFYFSLGILLTTVLQAFLTWRQSALFNFAFFIVTSFLVAIFTPESPLWLANFRSDWKGAKRSLRRLIANDQVFEYEWIQLQESIQSSEKVIIKEKLNISSPAFYKPIYVLLVLFVLQQFSCIYIVIMYALKVFILVSPNVSKGVVDEAFILFGVLRFVSSIIGSILSSKYGRKTLMESSSGGMAITSAIMVVSVAIRGPCCLSTKWDYFCEWTSMSMFLLFVFFGTFGVMSIPWTLVVELMPTKMRSTGSAYLVSFGYLLMFLLAKIFPFVVDSINVSLVFAFLSVDAILLGIFVHFCVPETLNKSFGEIERYFRSR